jgi:hypothetical protein
LSKRIIFSTGTPNDQGGVIPNNVIDFTRFNKNPVVLREHKWGDDPIGLWTDIRRDGDSWTGVPVFHRLTPESIKAADLYDGGWLRAASIGGEAIWKQNNAGQYALDGDGNRICENFYLYEISIVTLPSNGDAVQESPVTLSAKFYETGEIERINSSITTLKSKFYNTNTMEQTKPNEENKPVTTQAAAEQPKDPASTPVEGAEGRITLSANDLPGFMEKIIKGTASAFKAVFGAPTTNATEAPAPANTPSSKKAEKEIEPDPGPTGLAAKAEKAKEAAEKAKEAAEKAVKKAEKAKAKAEAENATDADKDAYKACMEEMEKAMEAAEKAESAYKNMAADDEGEDESDEAAKPAKEKNTNSASKPKMKTIEELKAEQAKLAAPPTEAAAQKAKVIREAGGKTFSQLASDKGEGRAILNRVITRDAGQKDLTDYAIVLNSIINDGKYAAVREKMRVHMNVNEAQLGSLRQMTSGRGGYSLENLSAQLAAGQVEMMGQDRVMRNITRLNSSDDALASPALTAIEWLPLAIFKLFPSTSWKNEVPIFAASVTGQNLGIIWANIAADPTIYKGTQPVSPTDYTYDDTAVSLKLTPYWLQPMRWTPLTMHYLRYDQMGTGWAQAFAKLGSTIDNDLIYTLASTVPASSIVQSSGLSGYQSQAGVFNIAGATDPNAFILNPAFTGNLNRPVLNDLIVLEQIYNKQNFDLEQSGERVVLVQDPTMTRFLSQDPETKSLLTRWVNADNVDLLKFKHTILHERSQVALYDPATGQVKDPSGVVPATAVSAGLSFIPSQVGIGLGMLDVFMVQDPSAYGYKMSADIRMGIAPLRKNYDGTGLYTYANSNV